MYKQRIENEKTDANLFMVSFVPLQLQYQPMPEDNEPSTSSAFQPEESAECVWKNPHPSSTRYCRPIKYAYVKETKEVKTLTVHSIQYEITNLFPTSIVMDGKTIVQSS